MYLYEYTVEKQHINEPEYFLLVTLRIHINQQTLVLTHKCHVTEEIGEWKQRVVALFGSPDTSMWLQEKD